MSRPLAILAALLTLAGCFDSDALPDDSQMFCVESESGPDSCWVPWGTTYAAALPSCTIADAIEAGVIGDAKPQNIAEWGDVECHEVTGTDQALCLVQPLGVVLTLTLDGWETSTDEQAADADGAYPPC